MKERNEETKKEGSTLEGVLGLAFGMGLSVAHSIQMYNLMERAGMYVTGEPPEPFYPELGTLEGVGYQLTAAAGTAALFFGGLYFGRLVGGAVRRLRSQNK